MTDLLSHLRSQAGLPSSPTFSYGSTHEVLPGAGGTILDELMELQRNVVSGLSELRSVSAKLRVGTKEAVMATSPEKEKKIAQRVAELVEGGKGKIVQIKGVLEGLKKIQNEEGADMTPAEAQMCGNVIASCSNQFKKNLSEYYYYKIFS